MLFHAAYDITQALKQADQGGDMSPLTYYCLCSNTPSVQPSYCINTMKPKASKVYAPLYPMCGGM